MSTKSVPERVAARAALLRTVRRFFDAAGYVEVDTPALARALIPEPSIEVFVTEPAQAAQPPTPLYLVPSPERWMKRLMAGGCTAIYQVGHAFRNLEEQGRWHASEFSMLEWYTIREDWVAARHRTTALVRQAAAALAPWRDGDQPAVWRSAEAEPEVHTVADLCDRELGSRLIQLSVSELRAVAERIGVIWSPQDDWEQLFHRLFLGHVEPTLATDVPVFVTEYPAAVPTLARAHPTTSVADRWELYLGGVEIANCFQEEVDRQRLHALFHAESDRILGSSVHRRTDWELVERFGHSPPCAGVALGIDRLLALLLGADGLASVEYCDTPD